MIDWQEDHFRVMSEICDQIDELQTELDRLHGAPAPLRWLRQGRIRSLQSEMDITRATYWRRNKARERDRFIDELL